MPAGQNSMPGTGLTNMKKVCHNLPQFRTRSFATRVTGLWKQNYRLMHLFDGSTWFEDVKRPLRDVAQLDEAGDQETTLLADFGLATANLFKTDSGENS